MVFKEELVLEFFSKVEQGVSKEKIVERELKTKPIENKTISIIGPRRAGKTFYLFQKKREHGGIYIDFESAEFSGVNIEDVIKIVSLYEKYFEKKVNIIYLDEIQNLKNWERLARTLLNYGYKLYISGSSSKLLSKEIATQLRGRSLTYLLLPFSFIEFLAAKGFKIKKLYTLSEITKIKKYLKEYLDFGGFPEVVLKEEKEKILKEYLELAFYKDFVERHKIESIEVAKIIFEYLLQNFSKEISVTKIQNFIEKTLRVKTRSTIYNYLDKLEDSLLVFFIERFEKSIYRRKFFPKKVYICDVGLAKIKKFSEDTGKVIENTVFLELLRKTNENPLMEIYYLKTKEGYEIDFLIKEESKIKQLIQVGYANSFDEIEEREIRALLHAKELFKQDKPELICITWDYEDEREVRWFGKKGKIKFIPLWKWLLSF